MEKYSIITTSFLTLILTLSFGLKAEEVQQPEATKESYISETIRYISTEESERLVHNKATGEVTNYVLKDPIEIDIQFTSDKETKELIKIMIVDKNRTTTILLQDSQAQNPTLGKTFGIRFYVDREMLIVHSDDLKARENARVYKIGDPNIDVAAFPYISRAEENKNKIAIFSAPNKFKSFDQFINDPNTTLVWATVTKDENAIKISYQIADLQQILRVNNFQNTRKYVEEDKVTIIIQNDRSALEIGHQADTIQEQSTIETKVFKKK